MPVFNYTPSAAPSQLSDGWHPGYLVAITTEATPQDWKMYASSPQMWRWHVALWEHPSHIGRQDPEHQSGITSAKFTPPGGKPASKAYEWTVSLLGRQVAPGESVDLDPLMPLACRVKVQRTPGKDFVKVIDLEPWTEGAGQAPSVVQALMQSIQQGTPQPAPAAAMPHTPPPASAPAPANPAMASWGDARGQQPVMPGMPPAQSRW